MLLKSKFVQSCAGLIAPFGKLTQTAGEFCKLWVSQAELYKDPAPAVRGTEAKLMRMMTAFGKTSKSLPGLTANLARARGQIIFSAPHDA